MDGTERKLAEELWRVAQQQPGGNDVIDYIVAALKTYGEARYKAGVEAMRDAVPWHERSFKEQVRKIAARLLEAK